jgi:UrcA family protein
VRSIIISAAAVFVLGAASAGAQEFNGERQVVVHYGDLDVASQKGAVALYARIASASAEVCGYAPANSDLAARKSFKKCSEAAEARAVKALPFDLAARMNTKGETLAAR